MELLVELPTPIKVKDFKKLKLKGKVILNAEVFGTNPEVEIKLITLTLVDEELLKTT